MAEIKTLGSRGYIKEGHDIISFQVGSTINQPIEGLYNTYNPYSNPVVMTVDGYSILLKGRLNKEPDEIEKIISENSRLPELIEKQIKLLYGKGARSYTEEFDENNKLVRKWADNPIIKSMFDNWQMAGLEHTAADTILQIIRRFYYFEELYPKFIFNNSRFLTDEFIEQFNLAPPMAGFQMVENKRTRLATKQKINVFEDDYEENDFDWVFVGNWTTGLTRKFKKYRKFEISKARKYKVAIGHYKNDAVGQIYGQNKFFKGTKEWIKGSNSTPIDLNSFFDNFFGAKVHIIIPDAWCQSKRLMLQKYAEINAELIADNKEPITVNGIDIGETFNENIFTQYVNAEVKKLTTFLSGETNQGKAFVSYSFKTGDNEEERWKFEEIDLKQKDHVEARLKYDKHAEAVILAAKGMDASISNITKEGVISKSGADLYYNYLIYLFMNRPIAEQICMAPFNDMIRVNKPALYDAGWRLGLYTDVPARQEEVSQENRLPNQE